MLKKKKYRERKKTIVIPIFDIPGGKLFRLRDLLTH